MAELRTDDGTLLNKSWVINRLDSAENQIDALLNNGGNILQDRFWDRALQVAEDIRNLKDELNDTLVD